MAQRLVRTLGDVGTEKTQMTSKTSTLRDQLDLSGRPAKQAKRAIDRLAVIGAKDRPVFVGASPRSGTTLLRTMLNSHPDLAIPRESRFATNAFGLREYFGDLSKEDNRQRCVEWIMDRRKSGFANLELDPEEAAARMMGAPGATIGSIVGTPFAMYAEATSAKRWGDKRPAYIRHTGRMFSMFPDAQFVHLVRDPRGSAASMLKVGWYDGSVPKAAELWVRSIEAAVAARAALRDDQFYELTYEDLLANPEGEIKQLTAWLGLDPAGVSDMLNFHRQNDVPASKYHWRVSEPIDPAAATAWMTTLDRDALALVEHVAGDHMDRLGYQRQSGSIAPPPAMLDAYERRRHNKQPQFDKTRRTYTPGLAAQLTSGQRRHASIVRAAARLSSPLR
jgi:hypothetical protein